MDRTMRSGSIVVGVDGSAGAGLALDWAAREASRRGLPVHLIHSFAPDHPHVEFGPGLDSDVLHTSGDQALEDALARVHGTAPKLQVTGATAKGYASGALVRASHDAAMVVLGARGLGLLGTAALGSVSIQVATHAACPVVVVRHPVNGPHRGRVVVGVDGSGMAAKATDFAFRHAEESRAQLVIVNAWWPENVGDLLAVSDAQWDRYQQEQEARVAQVIAGDRARHPQVEVLTDVVRGNPAQALLRHADGADLLVVGSRGRGGFTGLLLGSVSRQVLRGASCPVAIVRDGSEAML